MKNILYRIYLIVLVFIPILLVILPSDYFDRGNSICLSLFLFDTECYACGMTRAIQHLIHFDFLTGYNYNKLSIIVLPLLIYSYYAELRRIINKIY